MQNPPHRPDNDSGDLRPQIATAALCLDPAAEPPMLLVGVIGLQPREPDAVRTLATLSLIGLLMLCPLICGAEEIAHGARLHGATNGPSGDSPSHCPEEGDNCICQGAVQLDDIRSSDQDSGAVSLPPLFHISFLTPLHPIAHLTWNGSPTGLAGWGGSLAVQAFLQIFRC